MTPFGALGDDLVIITLEVPIVNRYLFAYLHIN